MEFRRVLFRSDDAMSAGLVRAATNICEAFIGQWLVVRAGEEVAPLPAECIALRARPVVAVDGVVLVSQDGTESPLDEAAYRVTISRDGSACITVPDPGAAARVRVAYRAGTAEGASKSVRQGH